MEGLTGVVTLGAGLLGVLVGVVSVLAFRLSERAQRRVPALPAPPVDEGIVRVLAVLRSAAVVLDESDRVVRASAPALALGLVREGRLAPVAVRELVARVRRDGVIADEELEVPRGPHGPGLLLLQVRVAQVTHRHVLVLAEDLTGARRLEAVRRDFVVNVSHELKTPVGALSLLAEATVEAAEDPEAVRRFGTRMRSEAARLGQLVQEIIELSRLQSTAVPGDAQRVRIADVLGEAADRARTVAAAKEIEIVVGEDAGCEVVGDHNLLVTAVRNLLDNAVAYSNPGTRVGVGVRRLDDVVEIAVVDQGIGIGADDLERVFERFYRVDPARSRDTGGTGLGLSIVKHVALDHGGDVAVWSRPGRGSTFTLRLPLAPERAAAPAAIGPGRDPDPETTRSVP
ncbi:sensor histidine kinase [Cellulomonas marina]|uniref:Sensor-like histidine kinase SenX3 n=1 Tax=Cellulomonas marina TaxID=988821 RepID=A0A1I0WL81_9CELL|nr:ATP-binding protein [Cellulomonas marina]GIG27731.1 two-component sensor histidine kinase [Cellulomonas marina]SFA89509.1 two-component system, OmpR family, sensor histidine kinase SenX3 [Cellulomonas marina]